MMKDDAARKRLRKMLLSFTGGSVLHLLGEVYTELAEEARQDGDEVKAEQYQLAAGTLVVVGLGIDASCPR